MENIHISKYRLISALAVYLLNSTRAYASTDMRKDITIEIQKEQMPEAGLENFLNDFGILLDEVSSIDLHTEENTVFLNCFNCITNDDIFFNSIEHAVNSEVAY